MKKELPYLITKRVITEKKYNPNYGDNRMCICGHTYERHFDSYDDMNPVGCKYCECFEFREKVEGDKIFLLRVHDYDVWEEDLEKPGCYRSMSTAGIKNRQNAYSHWDYDSLVGSRNFIPISEAEVPENLAKHKEEIAFVSWQCRNDGHGGSKGGTREEYIAYLAAVKAFDKAHPNWKKERDERNGIKNT